ncbi:hypothetical protein P885DRAFT_65009 [Corynascus similis CBS 632.67]
MTKKARVWQNLLPPPALSSLAERWKTALTKSRKRELWGQPDMQEGGLSSHPGPKCMASMRDVTGGWSKVANSPTRSLDKLNLERGQFDGIQHRRLVTSLAFRRFITMFWPMMVPSLQLISVYRLLKCDPTFGIADFSSSSSAFS